ncbi:matrixin domain-containing protein [Ditylenchus destructor]|uniref:Matrixin domain-containing protein n=1 Tax=Ditylenchus destructor TaxID=166010 RepID=A0AAD4RDU8_9BILA|nr:matrixin domain-containing protein [Ditylenchus destructor]
MLVTVKTRRTFHVLWVQLSAYVALYAITYCILLTHFIEAAPSSRIHRRHVSEKTNFMKDEIPQLREKSTDGFDPVERWRNIAIKYLNEFGYLSTAKPTPRELHNAVRSFQDLVGIRSTGTLNEQTMEHMLQPRCGNQDISRNVLERRKRFVYISRWESRVQNNVLRLKWYIQNYTKDIPRAEIKKTVKKAFHLWSSQVKISSMESLSLIFEEANAENEADITIMWAEGDHGDAHKFDGPGMDGSNILAHTFYPNYQSKGTLNGDIHLDDYELWHVNSTKDGIREGASFPHVLVHEIGHTLGLGHSKKQQAIMFPIYRKEHLDLMQLDLDDKCAINWSYVGASDLCLYIWLLSEVLPKKIAIEKDMTYMISNDRATTEKPFSIEDDELLREKLKRTVIPLCKSDNNVQKHLENMLVQRLGFPRQLAQDYDSVLCRFFDSFQSEYSSATTDNFHDVFRAHGVHNYYQDDDQFDALQSSDFQNRQFNSDFFKKILSEFVQ